MWPMTGAWILSPRLRFPLACLFVIPVFVLELVLPQMPALRGTVLGSALSALVAVFLGVGAYGLYVRLIERRPVSEFDRRGAGREWLGGIALGAAMFAATIGTLFALGLYQVQGRHDASIVVIPLLAAIGTGFMEEILFRGIVFRLVENALGTWWSLALSSALFGLIHLVNPHATLQGAIAIVFEAGVMLAAAYILTRRLWLPIGIHTGWNFTQGGIFGVSVSGQPSGGLLDGTLTGPEWLSGGAFGAEASIVAVVLGIALGTTLLVMAARRGRFIAPRWRRPVVAVPAIEPAQPQST
jgi:membrane protease YdiL (CAAX protease family)